jgi:hypothetical protein
MQHGLLKDHWWHAHNVFLTYRVRLRGTKDSWLTLIDKGEVTACAIQSSLRISRSPWREAGARTSGHQRAGKVRYGDYAKDPWKTFATVNEEVGAGTYEYFYPVKKGKIGNRHEATGNRRFLSLYYCLAPVEYCLWRKP